MRNFILIIIMPAKKACSLMQRINKNIVLKRTLTPGEMARQLGISERQLYNYLNLMKEMGAPIHFSRRLNRYIYKEEGYFFVGFMKDP